MPQEDGNRRWRREQAVKQRQRAATGASRPSGHSFFDVKISMSGCLDLVENGNETRAQLRRLAQLKAPAKRSEVPASIYVDISKVTFIEPVALVYFAAQLDRLAASMDITGNYPKARGPLQLLRDAGYEEFLRIPQQIRLQETSGPKVKLMAGSVSELMTPEWWMPLYEFMIADKALSPEEADELYSALNELVENVRQHAYRARIGKWYGVALRADATRPGRIVVVDLGQGISRSLGNLRRTDFQILAFEVFQRFVAATNEWARLIDGSEGLPADLHDSLRENEWMRVWAATQGFRNRTKGPGRGTGLSSLVQTVEKSRASALHVLSGGACVSYEPAKRPRRVCLPSLRGTAVCLDIGRPVPLEG